MDFLKVQRVLTFEVLKATDKGNQEDIGRHSFFVTPDGSKTYKHANTIIVVQKIKNII